MLNKIKTWLLGPVMTVERWFMVVLFIIMVVSLYGKLRKPATVDVEKVVPMYILTTNGKNFHIYMTQEELESGVKSLPDGK